MVGKRPSTRGVNSTVSSCTPSRIGIMKFGCRRARNSRLGSLAARRRKKVPRLIQIRRATRHRDCLTLRRRGGKALVCDNLPKEGQMETYDSHKTTTEVRQGSRTLDNFWVLVISMVAVIAIFAIIYFVFFATTPPSAISP